MKRITIALITLIAMSVLLTACGDSVPANDPVNVVKETMQAVSNTQLDQLVAFTCAAKKKEVGSMFNPAGALVGEGVELQKIWEAVKVTIRDAHYSKISEENNLAVVKMSAKQAAKVDREKLKAVLVERAQAQGQEIPADQLDSFLNTVVNQLEQIQEVNTNINVIKENGQWVICPDI